MTSAFVDDDGGVHSDPSVVKEFHGREGEDNGGRNQGYWWIFVVQSGKIREDSVDAYKMPRSGS